MSSTKAMFGASQCAFRPYTQCQISRLIERRRRFDCVFASRYSSTSTPSPLLSRLRDDLKVAMRAKDTPRLNVLRAVLADITNSSKTNTPIKDDLGLLALLKKRAGATKQALQQAEEAKRDDLVTKEKEQLNVLEDYAQNIQTIDENEIRNEVLGIVDTLRAAGQEIATGSIMKKCFGPDGVFEGRMVEKSAVARVVKEVSTK